MPTTALFVYGTLKRSCGNHDLLAGQKFLGEAQTLPHYCLYDRGPYPCLVEDGQRGAAVRGEVWSVDEATLARLDEYEAGPDTFVRGEIKLTGFSTPVFAYSYRGDVSGMWDCGDTW
jgi:gamma-glutamylcyclotransferase (GGCT)/AIG2-like uncharacterized protein YtfP